MVVAFVLMHWRLTNWWMMRHVKGVHPASFISFCNYLIEYLVKEKQSHNDHYWILYILNIAQIFEAKDPH